MRKRIAIGLLTAAAALGWVAYAAWFRDTRPLLTRAPDAPRGAITVGRNVHVSPALAHAPHYGCTIVADPTDARRLFAASMHVPAPNESGVVGYYSHDGGATWRLGAERVGQGAMTRLGDEALAFAPDGGLYLAHMRGTPDADKARASTDFAYSGDGGKTWEERGTLRGKVDRPQIAVDGTGGPFRGRLYCNANDNRPLFYASGDGGRTLEPAAVLPAPRLITVAPSNPVILPDGTVVVAYRQGGGNALAPPAIPVWRSSDGGKTFTAAAPVPTAWRHGRARSNSGLWTTYPLLAADPGSPEFAGRLYCAWADGPTSDERYVLFSKSADGGRTWSVPVCLSEQPLGTDRAADWQAEIPAVAVNRAGVVAVSWYDRRGLPKATRRLGGAITSAGYNVRLRASADGGDTWLPSVQVNEAPGRGHLLEVRDWAGLAADAAGRFHPAWISDATGAQQVWTATVDVKPHD